MRVCNNKPLAIDLYAGLGGWAEGFLAEGYDVIGFDIERHDYGAGGYPGQLVLQDVLTLHGSQLARIPGLAAIVGSPPCQKYSYMAMPWKRSKREVRWQQWERTSPFGDFRLNELFDACFRIQREASEAAGRYIPLVVENVCGAQKWVGRAAWHHGSFYLWGDVPALMPITFRTVKVDGFNFHAHEKTGQPGGSFQSAAVAATKNSGGSWFNVAHNTESGHGKNPDGRKVPGIDLTSTGFNCAAARRLREERGTKQRGSDDAWFDKALDERRKQASAIKNRKDRPDYPYSPGDSRKAASAQIAKIPFPLAEWIARVYKPVPITGSPDASIHAANNRSKVCDSDVP